MRSNESSLKRGVLVFHPSESYRLGQRPFMIIRPSFPVQCYRDLVFRGTPLYTDEDVWEQRGRDPSKFPYFH